ncbi:MAG: hypothetical protein U0172_03570 [Nitrospiraceae bacterium]
MSDVQPASDEEIETIEREARTLQDYFSSSAKSRDAAMILRLIARIWQEQAKQQKLKWFAGFPTQTGFYWTKSKIAGPYTMWFHVAKDGGVYLGGTDEASRLSAHGVDGFLFAGPIPEPEA